MTTQSSFWSGLKTYLRGLFDFRFSTYVTIQALPWLYGLMMVTSVASVGWLVMGAWLESPWRGGLALLLSPLMLLFLISLARGVLEFYIVIFRIAEDLDELLEIRESVDKLTDFTNLPATLTRKIPLLDFIAGYRRPTERADDGGRRGKSSRDPENKA